MTVKDLSQLYYLKQRLARNEERLKELRSRYFPGSPVVDGMPHGSGDNNHSKTEQLAVEVANLEMLMSAQRVELVHEEQELEQYIRMIPDQQTRLIIECRFIDCMSWAEVADAVGGGNTEDSVKKRCYRYIDSTRGDSDDHGDPGVGSLPSPDPGSDSASSPASAVCLDDAS